MEAVRDGTFCGKIVIYPQIGNLPLTRLEDLSGSLPEVAAKLGPALQWTREAEAALLGHFLGERVGRASSPTPLGERVGRASSPTPLGERVGRASSPTPLVEE